jgi:ribosomal protein L11 methyltransferase
LALLLLESLPVTGSRVLDVGTGSGILSLAACRFGASQTLGFDLDSGAVLVARQIARLNASPEALFFAGAISALSPTAHFDVALVNAMPHQVASELPEIVQRVRPGGALVVSGFLAADGRAVLAAWQEQGARVRRRLKEEEWGAALLDRGSR